MSIAAKAHGMDGTLVEPDWPPLRSDEIRSLLRQFPELDGPVEIVSCSPRPLSAAGVVATRGGHVFVKRHHYAVRDCEGLLEEHRFIAHLARTGRIAPRVLACESGETAIELGEWTYEVHETPPGIDLYEEAISWTPFRCAAHARAAGKALARLHLASADFDAPRRKVRPLVASFTIFAAEEPATELEAYISARPSLADHDRLNQCALEALHLLQPFHRELAPVLPELKSLWTHNDLHCSNLFWSDASQESCATAVIDFGLADLTNAVHDIAHAIERNIVEWLVLVQDPAHPERVPIHFDHLDALLAGYESVRRLTAAEAAALAPMGALCHAEFALSESDYFLGVLHSEHSARMAYDGWLLGHARWFRGAGVRLVDALREWAAQRTRA
ncbi:MAG TPA: phosphotransferase [Terracidiphilus sp.]|nr:phosphotransferase [Terracidiphilus sp.]